MGKPDFRYYREIVKLENILGGEDSLRSEINDLINESEFYITALKIQIKQLEKENKVLREELIKPWLNQNAVNDGH